jgi:PST family polysaccharide transporter
MLLVLSSPWRLSLGFDREEIRGVVGFGASILGFNLMQYLSRNSDRAIIGRRLGAIDLGYYDYAYQWYMYPFEAITGILVRVIFPTLSRLQDDTRELGRAFLRANGAIAILTFPMMTGLAAVADPLVQVVLGEKWAPIVPIVLVLAPGGLLQGIGATPGQLFLAQGRATQRLAWSVAYTAVIVSAFLVGVRWGIFGVAAAYTLVMVPICIAGFWLALRLVRLRLLDLWRTLRGSLVSSVCMGLAVALLRVGLETFGCSRVAVVVVCVPVGIALYVLINRWLRPDALLDVHRLLPKGLRDRRLVKAVLIGE